MKPISIAYKNILGDSDFVYLDIGARHGPSSKIKELFEDNVVKLILVEFEKEEIKKLKDKNYIVCEKPLWSEVSKKKIYQTKNKSYSSLLEPNLKVINGSFYADRNFYEIEEINEKETTTLKELLFENQNKFSQFDFIKIDVQGAEDYILQSFDSVMWNNLIGCKTETYTNKLYENTQCVDKLIPLFYKNNFEIFNLKKISSMIRTSFMKERIYSKDYFEARPNSKFYRGKDSVYDILFLKSIDNIIQNKNKTQIRKVLFILMLYGYYDHAFFTLLKSNQNKIFKEKDFMLLKKSMRQIIDNDLPFLWKIKEKFLLKIFKLKII